MVKKKQIDEKKSSSYLSSNDGYRLRFMYVGQPVALAQNTDTDAICIYSPTIKGAICGGIKHNGTTVVPFGAWVPGNAFTVAADSGIDLPGAIDQSD